MVFDIHEVSGISEFVEKTERKGTFYSVPGGRVFLVVGPNTVEVRTDEKLGRLLSGKYESVMESRYFGRGGIEIVTSGQLSNEEIADLVRLSYNMTKEMKDTL